MSTSVSKISVANADRHDAIPMGQTTCCSRGYAGRIEGWLLHNDIQLDEGAEQGGIAGWLDRDGTPEFVYPEIAGYYLTILAWLASGSGSSPQHVSVARVRAHRTVAWISKLMSGFGPPPTRRYLSDGPADWRNDAVFSFDLAMVARGMSAWRSTCPNAKTLDRLGGWLQHISSGAPIMVSHEQVGANTLPQRWSTRPGAHHLKAAAAVLRVDNAPESLTDNANRTILHWASVLLTGDWPCRELHALCYGIEGLLIADTGDSLDQAALAFTRLMQLQSADGTLTEMVDGGVVRSDVLAQALRIGLLLRGRGYLAGPDWGDRLDALADALKGFVRVDGGVLFARDQTIANTWCAMFAQQALYLYTRRHSREPVPANAFRYLV